MTRSPAAIMPKSAMAFPTEPRSWAWRRSKVREGFASTEFGSTDGPGSTSSSSAILGGFEVLCLDITNEGSGRQRFAGSALQQVLHEHLRAQAIDVGP